MNQRPRTSSVYEIKSSWVVHHRYEVMEISPGNSFLVPGEGGFYKTYDPFECSDSLIVDALNLGDRYKSYLRKKNVWNGIDDALQRELRPYLQDHYKRFLKLWKNLEMEMVRFAGKY